MRDSGGLLITSAEYAVTLYLAVGRDAGCVEAAAAGCRVWEVGLRRCFVCSCSLLPLNYTDTVCHPQWLKAA